MRYGKLLISGLVIASLLSSTSCFSLRPWFGEDKRVFDEALLGRWVGRPDDALAVYKVKPGPNTTYKVTWHEIDDKRAGGEFVMALARIDGVNYLDLRGRGFFNEEDDDPWLTTTHLLMQLEFEEDALRIRSVDPDKLLKLVENGKLKGVDVDRSPGTLIVSTTDKLQAFLADHGRTADIWLDEDEDLLFRRQE